VIAYPSNVGLLFCKSAGKAVRGILTQAEASRLFGFEQRSSRRRVSGKRDVPYFLVIMLRMMLSGTVLVKACKTITARSFGHVAC
jgi:hypothetical protein